MTRWVRVARKWQEAERIFGFELQAAADDALPSFGAGAHSGRNRHRIRQPWYPVVEHFGALWTYMGPPEKQPLFPLFSCFEDLRDDEKVEAVYFSANGEIQPFPVDHNWFQTYDNCTDHYHVPILHSRISGNQFPDPRLSSKIPEEIKWKYTDDKRSILTTSKRVIEGTGQAWMRIEQGITFWLAPGWNPLESPRKPR